jgi:hypothetical protein
VVGTTTVPGGGTWSITPVNPLPGSGPLADVVVPLTVTQTDVAGNVSGTVTTSIRVDTIAPVAPTIDSHPDTRDQRPLITGTGEVGATVTLFADTDVDPGTALIAIGTGVVNAAGTWSIVPNTNLPANGTVALSATQTDLAGNVSPAVSSSIRINPTAGPSRPLFSASILFPTNDTTPDITGTRVANAAVEVRADTDGDGIFETSVGNVVAGAGTTWTLTSVHTFGEGTFTLQAIQTIAGAASSPPNFTELTIDSAAPSAPTPDFRVLRGTGSQDYVRGNEPGLTVLESFVGGDGADYLRGSENTGTIEALQQSGDADAFFAGAISDRDPTTGVYAESQQAAILATAWNTTFSSTYTPWAAHHQALLEGADIVEGRGGDDIVVASNQ